VSALVWYPNQKFASVGYQTFMFYYSLRKFSVSVGSKQNK